MTRTGKIGAVQTVRHHGNTPSLRGLGPGDHVCAVIDDTFEAQAAACLAEGEALGQKLFRFMPAPHVRPVEGQNVTVVDPTDAFLAGGPLEPATMLRMFAEQTARAHAEGYTGIRLVADMDWLLRHPPDPPDVAAYELRLDQAVTELAATVVCAYRPASFGEAVTEAAAVHPLYAGTAAAAPSFRLFNTGGSAWQITGEVDITGEEAFRRAAGTAAACGPVTTLHCGGLEFLSAAGLGVISELARTPAPHPLVLQQTPGIVKYCWETLGLSFQQPYVTFTDHGPPADGKRAIRNLHGRSGDAL